MKRLIVFLLISAILLSFAGCDVPSVAEPTTMLPVQTHTVPITTTLPQPTTEPTSEILPEPPSDPKPEVIQITMSFVGDCTLGRNHKAAYGNSFDEYYDKYGADYFLENVRELFSTDDITVINLEGPLTTSEDIQEKTWNHKGDPAYVQILTDSSVEVAGMANNHRLDYGQSGSDETEQVLSDADVTYCFDDHYAMVEVKGVRVGIVSVNALEGYRVEKWLREGNQTLREQGCAVVAAMVHWGDDKATELNAYQKALGPRIIDMGYDVVVGHHPHVLQGIQEYKGKLICYSLGNFCYGGSKNPADKDSGIFQQTFTIMDGVLQEELQAQFIPCYLSGVTHRNDYRPTLAVGAEAQRIIDKINQYSAMFGFALDSEGKPKK